MMWCMNCRNVRINSIAALILSLLGAAFFAVGRILFGVGGWLVFYSVPAGVIAALALLALWFIPVRHVKDDYPCLVKACLDL